MKPLKQAVLAMQRRIPDRGSRRAEVVSISHNPSHEKEAVFNRLAEECQERIFRLALRITRNHADAEDAQQEALLKAHRNLSQFEGRARVTTWISRIAINESLMSLRKRRDALRVPFEEAAGQSEVPVVSERWQSRLEDPETAYARRELRQSLYSALSQLAPQLRVVFLLRAVEELSTVETAKILSLSASAVKARLRRARHELEQRLRITARTNSDDRTDQTYEPHHATKQQAGASKVARPHPYFLAVLFL
jgi:RNA polymerase sigma-70 factor (ECF subfamily)